MHGIGLFFFFTSLSYISWYGKKDYLSVLYHVRGGANLSNVIMLWASSADPEVLLNLPAINWCSCKKQRLPICHKETHNITLFITCTANIVWQLPICHLSTRAPDKVYCVTSPAWYLIFSSTQTVPYIHWFRFRWRSSFYLSQQLAWDMYIYCILPNKFAVCCIQPNCLNISKKKTTNEV